MLQFAVIAPRLAAHPEYIDRVHEVTEQISLLNLLRGLYLSPAQVETLIGLASEADRLRRETLAEIERSDAIPALEKLRDDLYTALPEEPPVSRPHAVEENRRLHHRVGLMLDRIAVLEEKVAGCLTRAQLDIFWSFIPCVVPEISFEQPVRVGQVAGSAKTLPIVELIRATPEKVWQERGREYLRELMAIFEREVGGMTDDVRGDLQHRLNMIALKIRRIPEAEFFLAKGRLARELNLIERENTLRSGHRRTGKLARFFLSPAAVKVLPRYLAGLRADGAAGTGTEAATAAGGGTEPAPLADPGRQGNPTPDQPSAGGGSAVQQPEPPPPDHLNPDPAGPAEGNRKPLRDADPDEQIDSTTDRRGGAGSAGCAPAAEVSAEPDTAHHPASALVESGFNACQHACLYARRTGDPDADAFAAAALESFRLLSEAPFLDHLTEAFEIRDPLGFVNEWCRDVPIEVLFDDAANILTHRQPRRFFTRHRGEP